QQRERPVRIHSGDEIRRPHRLECQLAAPFSSEPAQLGNQRLVFTLAEQRPCSIPVPLSLVSKQRDQLLAAPLSEIEWSGRAVVLPPQAPDPSARLVPRISRVGVI